MSKLRKLTGELVLPAPDPAPYTDEYAAEFVAVLEELALSDSLRELQDMFLGLGVDRSE